MNDKMKKRSAGGMVTVVALLLIVAVLPFLYVLSVGPVVWLANTGRIHKSWMPTIATAYWPLMWAPENVHVAGEAVVMYIEMWMPPQPTLAVPTAATVPAPATTPAPTPAGS